MAARAFRICHDRLDYQATGLPPHQGMYGAAEQRMFGVESGVETSPVAIPETTD